MFEKLKATMGMFMVLLGYGKESDIPVDAEKKALNFSDAEVAKLKAHFGDKYETYIQAINGEIKAFLDKDMDMKAIHDELAAIIAEKQQNQENLDDATNNNAAEATTMELVQTLRASAQKEKEAREKLEAQLTKLMDEGVGDKPDEVIKNSQAMKIVHSATHLFGDAKDYNKFEGRAWNARLRDMSIKATDFNSDSVIPTLQDDVAHFVRENPQALNSLFNDTLDLPRDWDRRTGVLDRVADGHIIAGEIVQGRSKGWKPKNNVKIVPEEGRVFRKKIDITFNGYELQEIENTWIRSYNGSDGSHPWKMTFVYFLLSEIVKQQMLDDRKAQINGIYSKTPDGETPGLAVHSQDGLRFLFWYHREISKKYAATNLGPITDMNIVDKVDALIKSIPETERQMEGLELGLSQANLDRYRTKAGLAYQLHMKDDAGNTIYEKNYPLNFQNIKFQPIRDLVNSDFMYITESKNIQIMDYNVSEKGKFTVQHDKRDTNIFADYRLGIRLKFVGTKQAPGEPVDFARQKVWTNEAPIFNADQKMLVYDDESGVIDFHFPNMVIDDAWKTNITNIENAPKGAIIKITGNTKIPAVKNIVDSAIFDLTGNASFDLSTGGTLTLLVNDNGTFKELKRTTSPETAIASDETTFSGTSIDASTASVFRFTGVADASLANIINGVEGKTIKIYGTDTADVELTVADVANVIEVNSNAVLPDSVSYVQLTLVDGKWFETKRSITA